MQDTCTANDTADKRQNKNTITGLRPNSGEIYKEKQMLSGAHSTTVQNAKLNCCTPSHPSRPLCSKTEGHQGMRGVLGPQTSGSSLSKKEATKQWTCEQLVCACILIHIPATTKVSDNNPWEAEQGATVSFICNQALIIELRELCSPVDTYVVIVFVFQKRCHFNHS